MLISVPALGVGAESQGKEFGEWDVMSVAAELVDVRTDTD